MDHRWDGERALSTAGPPVLLSGLPAGLPEGAQKPVALSASVNIHAVSWGAAADRGEDEEWTARPSGSRGLVPWAEGTARNFSTHSSPALSAHRTRQGRGRGPLQVNLC